MADEKKEKEYPIVGFVPIRRMDDKLFLKQEIGNGTIGDRKVKFDVTLAIPGMSPVVRFEEGDRNERFIVQMADVIPAAYVAFDKIDGVVNLLRECREAINRPEGVEMSKEHKELLERLDKLLEGTEK